MIEALLTGGQRELRDQVRAFVREDVPRQLILDMDAGKVTYPRQFLECAAARKLLGLRFPPEYGGRGLGWLDEIIALEEVGVLGTSLACLYSLPSIVGEAVNVFGTPEQKERWLRPVLEGKLTVAEALTEPRGGSDFFGTTTTARREGDEYILNGQKRFIVGAEGADYFIVYARTNPDARSHQAISLFVVGRGPGVDVQHVYGLMGTRGGGTGRVYFRDARVPAFNLIGRENGASDIFYQMMIPERMTSAAGALGMARAALEIAARYSDRRKAFGQKIRAFEGVSFKVADCITLLDAASSLVYATARAIDSGDDPARVRRMVSESKKFATDAAWQIVNHAMQIMGGIGYTSVYPIERLLRDTRLITIWTGTNEIMDSVIQHEYYKELGAQPIGRDVEADAPDAEVDGEKIKEVLDRIGEIVNLVPQAIADINVKILTPLRTDWFSDDPGKGLKSSLIEPITTKLLDPLEALMDNWNNLLQHWETDLTEPTKVALDKRESIRKEIADYKLRNRLQPPQSNAASG